MDISAMLLDLSLIPDTMIKESYGDYFYGNYYDIPMDIDEFVRFKTSIQIFTHSPSFYVQFNYQNFINKFYNYGSVIIPLKECIEYYIINRYYRCICFISNKYFEIIITTYIIFMYSYI